MVISVNSEELEVVPLGAKGSNLQKKSLAGHLSITLNMEIYDPIPEVVEAEVLLHRVF